MDHLRHQQRLTDKARVAGNLKVTRVWANARRSKALKEVVRALEHMSGTRARCMYCLDSHGTDIDHFWPKARYPERLFEWLNLLLGCAECGRLKGDRFPLDPHGQPLLVDPTAEDPWRHLDFEPSTGIVMARFDVVASQPMAKGAATVEVLQLDQREAMNTGYRRTVERLAGIVQTFLAGDLDDATLCQELSRADDHGLLGWCFSSRGRQHPPFFELHEEHRGTWDACVTAFADPEACES